MKAAERKPFEIPKAVLLDKELWSAENGLATPSMKLKANKIKQLHRHRLEFVYQEMNKRGGVAVGTEAAAQIVAAATADDFEGSLAGGSDVFGLHSLAQLVLLEGFQVNADV
eukprot:gnl/Chilomastix_caulleri/1261.p2 GENE.gnl/Chilomastix_caulleri/1261~~gnl/Chilomastix_caulleri/1261.p2  ORF type:complete len:112 (+),score=24.70 gnl/Chilomastix_caulleri/1261:139-474(+)